MINIVTEQCCTIHYKQKYVLYDMNQMFNILAAYITMMLAPFYGDIFSATAQMTVKTIIPLVSG